VPALRFKYLHLLDETGAHGVRVASTDAILGEHDRFAYTRRGQLKEVRPVPYAVVSALPRFVKSIGDATGRLNQVLADDLPRAAKFTTEARRSAAVRRIQRVGGEIGDSVTFTGTLLGPSTEQILRGLTDEERLTFLRKTNEALGDFNNLSPFERRTLRRFMPFYAWFKAISVVTKDLAIHHPDKVNLLRNLEVAADQNSGIVPQGKLPSWLVGAIATSPPNRGAQEMLTAVGLNPFQTPVQIGEAAGEVGERLAGKRQREAPIGRARTARPRLRALRPPPGHEPAHRRGDEAERRRRLRLRVAPGAARAGARRSDPRPRAVHARRVLRAEPR